MIFSEVGPGGRIAQAGVLSATPTNDFEILAIAPTSGPTNIYPPNTATSAIAIVNPADTDALISFQLVDGNGHASAAPIARRLAAHNHTAFFERLLIQT